MAWTTTGTVSVTNNSAIVYGAGTSWASSNLVRGGDIFKAPDGNDYQVLSVQSNTQLTLATAYLGMTASAQSYALIHTGLLPAELAVNLSDLQSKYLVTTAQLYEWETSVAATVPLTNPATQVTTQVKPIAGLIADIDVAKTASGTSNTPAGNISATTVQAAINELDAEKAALSGASFTGPLLVTTAAPLGYGPGAGGTVFQATSKTTDVTLNKPAGVVFTHNSELPVGGVATLVVNNSFVGPHDNVVVTQGWGNEAYRIQVQDVNNGYFKVQLENRLSYSMSEGIRFNFTIFKGASA